MPNCPSPMSTSPDNLSKMRLNEACAMGSNLSHKSKVAPWRFFMETARTLVGVRAAAKC
jgi:hypothetical protein